MLYADAPYSIAESKVAIEAALRDLFGKADEIHGPVVILEDGGLTAEVLAEKVPHELHRVRIVEITKGGERGRPRRDRYPRLCDELRVPRVILVVMRDDDAARPLAVEQLRDVRAHR